MAIEFEMKVEIKIDKKTYEAVNRTQGCEGCIALSDPELCDFLSITLANETFGGLSENNSGNIKHFHHNDICDIFRLIFVQPEQEPEPEPVVWMSCEPSTGLVFFENSGKEEHGWIPLYTSTPAPKPLSDEEIAQGAILHKADIFGTLILAAFVSGIKFAEKAHGIRGGK